MYSSSFDQHLKDLKQVLQRLKTANFLAKVQKCVFARSELPFLGFIVGKEGVRLDPSAVEAVCKCPGPKDRSEVRRFLGMASQYRRHIFNYARIVDPLVRITSEEIPFLWENEQQEAFDYIKKKLTEAPVMAYPDPTRSFILYTDASDFQLGAVLCQKDRNGIEHVVSYGSRMMSKSERNYSTTEREGFAVVQLD